jgi:DNA ligase-1
VKDFAILLDSLAFQPSRNGKLTLLTDYFARTPDPDRGYALAALASDLELATAKPKLIRDLVAERVDPELFRLSYDFVGDLAETAALVWPDGKTESGPTATPGLTTIVEDLNRMGRSETPGQIAHWLDNMDPTTRWGLLKLITGGLRVGVSARLAKTALAELGTVEVSAVEEVWHAVAPPYTEIFAWLEGRAPIPDISQTPTFRPLMLATPIEETDLRALDPAAYLAEWKWDGIRVQIVAQRGEDGELQKRLYSRTGDDIGATFPDILDAITFEAVLDGELLVAHDGMPAPFNDLQQRLNRKRVDPKLLAAHPAHIRLYDMLVDAGEDVRDSPLIDRRTRLENWYRTNQPARFDLSPVHKFDDWESLTEMRANARSEGIEGLMIKQVDSIYQAGRPRGPWFKWKRDPLLIDAVLMYAQRGHGKRSSFYSDFTFGCWRKDAAGADELVPVGKAYFGFTDAELSQLDRWIRNNTTNRYGPVREVEPGLVFEVAFDSIHPSKRHKSGVAMRFPRIHRIRWDKPIEEADRLEALETLIG